MQMDYLERLARIYWREDMRFIFLNACIVIGMGLIHYILRNLEYRYCSSNIFIVLFMKESLFCTIVSKCTRLIEEDFIKIIPFIEQIRARG